MRIAGRLEVSVLRSAVAEVTRRHEVLQGTQSDAAPVAFAVLDVDAAEPERLVRLREAETLGSSLMRWTVLRVAPDEHEIVIMAHPAIHDSRSSHLLLREVATLYGSFVKGEAEPSLPDLPVQYRDYAAWQREVIGSAAMRARLAYWRRRLGDPPTLLDLPRRHVPRTAGRERDRWQTLEAALPAGLGDRCREEGMDPLAFALAAFASLLHRYTTATDICVCSTFANRGVAGTEHMLGAFANTLVLRLDLSGDPVFRDLTRQAAEVVREAAAHQEYPFAELTRVVKARSRSRDPLSRVTFDLEAARPSSFDFGGVPATVEERPGGLMDTDLAVAVRDGPDRISLTWTYDETVFDAATMRQMLSAYLVHTDAATALDVRVSDLPLLGEQERHSMPSEGTDAAVEELVHEAVGEWARRSPPALAIRDGHRELTYAELDAHATLLGAHLRRFGVGPDHPVGILLTQGIDMTVAALGVLKAGGAYLPLDPEHPDGRLAYLCGDTGTAVVVTTGPYVSRVPPGVHALPLDSLDAAPETSFDRAGQRNLAYVMYTSGSTGLPKGVMIEHSALASFVDWYRREYGIQPADRIAVVNAPGFDASVIDLWPALTAGASLHVPDQETRLAPRRLQAWLLQNRITIVFLTTALAEPMLDLPWPDAAPLRWLQTGGDVFRRRPRPGLPFKVGLAYGPTENTVMATAGPVEPASGAGDGSAPDIGRPLATTAAYVLDERLRPVPPGARGELYLGGAGLARGYLRRPGLTAERFVPDPFAAGPGGRLYRTGDLARYRPDGRIDFLGRADAQIKLRGNRVEPGEIESALCRHPLVAQAHVAVRNDGPGGGKRLVGYLVPRTGHAAPPPDELRAHLERSLPRFMVPAAWMPLDRLPLNASGKIDAGALPSPDTAGGEARHEPPATRTERVVAEVWCGVLERSRVSVLDNFFDIGGHSMLIYRVRDQLLEQLGRGPAIVDFFQYPTVRALAGHIDDSTAGAPDMAGPSGTDQARRRRSGLNRLEKRRAHRAGAEERHDR